MAKALEMSENKDIYYYHPAKITELSSMLAEAYSSMEADGGKYVKSATINKIIVVPAGFNKSEIEELIYTLTLVHPNRTFLIVLDDNCNELEAEFSTRCHKVSKEDHVCSEVIRLYSHPDKISELKTVLRANLITGVNTELILTGELDPVQTYKQFGDLSEQIIYSSSSLKKNFSEIKKIIESDQVLVDLEWINIGEWRQQIKEAFASHALKEKIDKINRIELTHNNSLSSALLLAGWITYKLGFDYISGNKKQFNYLSKNGKKLELSIQEKEDKIKSILGVVFKLEVPSEYISISISDTMNTDIYVNGHIRTTRPLENYNFIELIKRYYFVGDSTINYKPSLLAAYKLST